jgi:uncharacterized membrane protein
VLVLLVIVIQILISVLTYPFLPALVPSHWDAAGRINGYMPKLINALIYPIISTFLYVMLRAVAGVGPRLGRDNQRANLQFRHITMVAVVILMLIVQIITTTVALGIPVDVVFVLNIALGLLFIVIGNYMGRVRRNFWAGIRTPWTLASDTVWERTHRVGGWLFVLVGALGLLLGFVPGVHIWGLIVLLFAATIFLYVYSYIAYHRLSTVEAEPLSPPFDQDRS